MPYFRMGVHTIIGAGRFHFRGRDGIGWFPPAMAARQFVAGPFPGFPRGPALPRHGPKAAPRGIRTPPRAKAGARMPMQSKILSPPSRSASKASRGPLGPLGCYMAKPHGQLVSVSCTHYCASTPDLSTWWSSRALQGVLDPREASSWEGLPA